MPYISNKPSIQPVLYFFLRNDNAYIITNVPKPFIVHIIIQIVFTADSITIVIPFIVISSVFKGNYYEVTVQSDNYEIVVQSSVPLKREEPATNGFFGF